MRTCQICTEHPCVPLKSNLETFRPARNYIVRFRPLLPSHLFGVKFCFLLFSLYFHFLSTSHRTGNIAKIPLVRVPHAHRTSRYRRNNCGGNKISFIYTSPQTNLWSLSIRKSSCMAEINREKRYSHHEVVICFGNLTWWTALRNNVSNTPNGFCNACLPP